MTNRRRITILLILSLVWAGLIFFLCTMPPASVPKIEIIPHLDKVAHFGVFFVQSLLLSLLFNFRKIRSYFVIILLSTLLSFLYGGAIELIQDKFFNRESDFFDLLADTAGGFSGAIFYPTVLRLFFQK